MPDDAPPHQDPHKDHLSLMFMNLPLVGGGRNRTLDPGEKFSQTVSLKDQSQRSVRL